MCSFSLSRITKVLLGIFRRLHGAQRPQNNNEKERKKADKKANEKKPAIDANADGPSD